ncbi:MAG: DCC1-like thiol-disulfide oxidoreductase family protein [Steroidobacteraceae bacterium]
MSQTPNQVTGTNAGTDILLVYDKQCPACDYYCNLVRIRESSGRLVLVDARDGGQIMGEITAAGLDIDQGMVVKVGGTLYYGSDAIHVLSLMGTNSGFFNRLTHWTFKYRPVARVLYPLLRACRNLLLKFLGKTKINNLGVPGNDRF